MIGVVQVLTKLCPDDAFAALDMVNAFGEISRAEILEEVLEYVPELASFLLQLWGEQGTPVMVANGANKWATFYLVDGLFQEHNLSSILFCLGMRRVMRKFENACSLISKPDEIPIHLEYIDDLLLKVSVHVLEMVIPLLERALASANLKLNHSKSKVFIPSAPIGTGCLNCSAAGLPQVHGRLELLGGAVEGMYATTIGGTSKAMK